MIPRMTTIELRQFVLNYCSGLIFTSADVSDRSMLPLVFLPLGMGGLSQLPESEIRNIGLFWEHLSAAGPRSINGLPMFVSVHMMHKADVDIVVPLIVAERERQAAYLEGSTDG